MVNGFHAYTRDTYMYAHKERDSLEYKHHADRKAHVTSARSEAHRVQATHNLASRRVD